VLSNFSFINLYFNLIRFYKEEVYSFKEKRTIENLTEFVDNILK
jgi:hypothetical protein